ncbi:MAG: general secretion pathway protein [Methylotenera sp.]|nr:MAG: general secretion pathway protein [Methylotenera sp.]PPD17619.1 MAG: general secretion pathway protein [Methylotenera sp.]
MYYTHFGLKEPPFKITPNTEVFYTGGKRGAVLDALIYAILNGEGIIKVVGEVGSGKTMLCRMLQTMLPEKIESIYLANPSVAPEDILHAIAFELQLKLPKNADRLKVMQVLQSHLLARHAAGKQVVIFVEEAQGMPLATLEEIRLLSNLETNHDKLLQIVLFGQPELDENLNQTQIRQLRERITHGFNLAPLEPKEIGEYLIFRLRAAGYFGPHLFTKSAINSIASSAQGLVRRVNILADKALLAAFADNVYQVTQKQVRAAIKDSEFGAEKAKLTPQSSQILKWLALLLMGLMCGYWASVALQKPAVKVSQPVVKKPVTIVAPESITAKAKPVLPSQPVEAPMLEQVAEPSILSRRLAETEIWLRNQPPTTVSIQLLGGYSDEQILNDLTRLSQQVELDNLYVYRTSTVVNGVSAQPFLTVLYGSFANRVEAVQALKNLPADIQKNQPQLRTVAGVLKETQKILR